MTALQKKYLAGDWMNHLSLYSKRLSSTNQINQTHVITMSAMSVVGQVKFKTFEKIKNLGDQSAVQTVTSEGAFRPKVINVTRLHTKSM